MRLPCVKNVFSKTASASSSSRILPSVAGNQECIVRWDTSWKLWFETLRSLDAFHRMCPATRLRFNWVQKQPCRWGGGPGTQLEVCQETQVRNPSNSPDDLHISTCTTLGQKVMIQMMRISTKQNHTQRERDLSHDKGWLSALIAVNSGQR